MFEFEFGNRLTDIRFTSLVSLNVLDSRALTLSYRQRVSWCWHGSCNGWTL